MSVDALIFIDANKYLDLYKTAGSRKLIPEILEQRDYIFVTGQVVDEVYRNKVNVAAAILDSHLETLKQLQSIPAPKHLVGTNDEIEELSKHLKAAKDIFKTYQKLKSDVLKQISQSRDEVSKALETLFAKAVRPSKEELYRAKDRKERGNPPGKRTDPLGDQLNWEQILTQCRDKQTRGLWIITDDSDYTMKGSKILNAKLYQDVAELKPSPDVFCFGDIDEGLRDFVEKTKVKAEKLVTPKEAEEIKKEQESLPSLDWIYGGDSSQLIAAENSRLYRLQMLRAALQNQINEEAFVPPPPETKEDKGRS